MESSKTKWAIDPAHSEFNFKVRHMMISTVSGHFSRYTATVLTEGDDFKTAKVKVKLDADSLSTNNPDRDAHLRSDDFFNAAQYPEITFKSTAFDGEKLTGMLTIRDITKEITLDVTFNGTVVDPYGQTKAGFDIRGEISRQDFNLKWNAITEAGSVVVSDKVRIEVEAQFVKEVENSGN